MSDTRSPAVSYSAAASYTAAAAVGVVAFVCLGIGRVHGFATFWDIPLGDAAQALNAISLFAHADEWRWPLLSFDHRGRDTVETIILADGIPLYALGVRALAGLGIDPPLLFIWRLLTVLGQAVAMAWLLRALGVRRLSLVLLGCGLAVMMPAFLFRGHANHLALSAHAVPIAGVAAAVALKGAGWRRAAVLWSGVLAASLLVHPYFLAINAALFTGWLIQRGLFDRAQRDAALALATASVVVGLVIWSGGYVQAAGMAGNTGGFGHYSFNLLGPMAVTQGWFVPGSPILDATGGQYEGYSYLGLGTLILLLTAITTGPRAIAAAVRRYPGLSLAAISLTAFATSDQVYVGPWHVADLSGVFDLLPALPETFRSSGRMVWPLVYLALAGAVARASVWWPGQRRAAVIACIALLSLQAADVRPMAVRWFETPVSGFNNIAWRELFRSHDHLALYPPSGCTETNEARFINPEYAYAAERYGLTTNSFSAEIARQDCPRAVPALEDGRLVPGTLYVFHSSVADYTTIRSGPGVEACRRFRDSFLCSQKAGAFDAASFLQAIESPVAGVDLVFGRRYPLDAGSPATSVLTSGWYAPEAWGTWSRSGEVGVLLPHALFAKARQAGASGLRLDFGARGFLAGNVVRRRIRVSVADHDLTTWVLATGDRAQQLTVVVPLDRLGPPETGPVRVTLEISGDLSPASAGRGSDARSLGLGVSGLRVTPADVSTQTNRR